MTDSLAIVLKGSEGCATVAQPLAEPPSPEESRAKRSAAAKKAAATRAAKKPAAQPATSLGECESCCDGTLATEVVGVTYFNSDGYKYCAKCADHQRKNDRKYLI